MIDINSFSTDELIALKAKLDGLTDVSGRTGVRPRQLHDLRLLPTKDDARPTFFMSAEPPRNAGDLTRGTPFPALFWHPETAQEVTAHDAKAAEGYKAQGYLTYPPFAVEVDPMDLLAAQIDALSDADRTALIESQKMDRIAAMRAKLAVLSEEKLAILLAQSEGAAVKRGPGRPRKESVA